VAQGQEFTAFMAESLGPQVYDTRLGGTHGASTHLHPQPAQTARRMKREEDLLVLADDDMWTLLKVKPLWALAP
jgi:hypothetical protein